MSDELKKYQEALETDPNNVETLCKLGRAFKDKNIFDKAKECFINALEIQPDYCPAVCCLFGLLIEEGKYSEGLNIFNEALINNNDNKQYKATMFNALYALFLLHKNDLHDPKSYEKINYEELLFKIGNIFKSNNLYKAAIKVFEQAIEISPLNIRLSLDLAESYINFKNFDKAEEFLLVLNNKYPGDEDIIFFLSRLYYSKKDFLNALKYTEIIVDKKPKNRKYLKNLFLLHKLLNNSKKSKEVFNIILKLSPEFANNLNSEIQQCSNFEELFHY